MEASKHLSHCLGWMLLLLFSGAHVRGEDTKAVGAYSDVAARLSEFIRREMNEKEIPAISIALVDDQKIVWSAGFGSSRTNVPANGDTIYRVGSVSKLFTDLAIMRLVEHGKLDLDVPITNYLPSFHPRNSFQKPITLRELMAHRSGLGREPPVGNYFDPTEPSLTETIASLNETELVYEPGTHEKYSNAGVAILGYLIETTQRAPYLDYIEKDILRPLGLDQSSFRPTPVIREKLADGLMWTQHGKTFAAPKFELGIAPAGCMYSSVNDLAIFEKVLFAGGMAGNSRIVKTGTLEQMWKVQFATPDTKNGYGLGFHMSQIQGERCASHGGAIYGFSTYFGALVDAKLGVVVIASKDFANTVTDRIGAKSMETLLSVKRSLPFPALANTEPIPLDLAESMSGVYTNKARGFTLERQGSILMLFWDRGGFPQTIRRSNAGFICDGTTGYGNPFTFNKEGGEITMGGAIFHKIPPADPKPAPERWRKLIGEYGWDHDTLYILERDGKLWALIEWFEYNPLEQVSENVFKFPARGLYNGEKLIFKQDEKGRIQEVIAANVHFKRRSVGPEPGTPQLQLKALRPVSELRVEALKAKPPAESGLFRKPDLVELTKVDPSLKLEIRYAGTNNFLGTPFYTEARAFMQRPAALAVSKINQKLHQKGLGLMIFDGYRPWFVTKVFWDATPDESKFLVADPSQGSRHNRGCAVDLTIWDLATGKPLEMVGTYDEATDRSYPNYPGGTSLQRWHRKILRDAMESEGFTVYAEEWWHFDYNEWRQYPIQNIPFDHLGN